MRTGVGDLWHPPSKNEHTRGTVATGAGDDTTATTTAGTVSGGVATVGRCATTGTTNTGTTSAGRSASCGTTTTAGRVEDSRTGRPSGGSTGTTGTGDSASCGRTTYSTSTTTTTGDAKGKSGRAST